MVHEEPYYQELTLDPELIGGSDEPTVVELAGGELLMLVRTTRGRHYQARSGAPL